MVYLPSSTPAAALSLGTISRIPKSCCGACYSIPMWAEFWRSALVVKTTARRICRLCWGTMTGNGFSSSSVSTVRTRFRRGCVCWTGWDAMRLPSGGSLTP